MVRPVMIVLCLLLLLCFSTILSEAIRERGYDLHKSVLRSLPLALRNSTLTSVVEHSGHVKALVNARAEAFLRVVAPLSGIWLWLAPLPTLRRAQRMGTTGGLRRYLVSGLPELPPVLCICCHLYRTHRAPCTAPRVAMTMHL